MFYPIFPERFNVKRSSTVHNNSSDRSRHRRVWDRTGALSSDTESSPTPYTSAAAILSPCFVRDRTLSQSLSAHCLLVIVDVDRMLT
ncbi:hypothetical protein J6590_022749 [Homalodisca vitripennis]|nr:hypothetical protein J6590_022749 [Homalodisca vitripennis]